MFNRSIRRIHDLSSRRERHFVVSGLTSLGLAAGASAATAAATGAAIVGAGAAAAGAATAAGLGIAGNEAQKDAMAQQKKAQNAAAAAARTQQRRSQQSMAAANRAEPAVADIMGRAAAEMGGGPSSTMLTGPMGVNTQELQLGRTSLLGG
jgi:hypothetical protein